MDRLDAHAFSLPGVDARVVASCPSTNTLLLEEESAACVLLAAEEQTAGRGRRGRRWHSSRGAGLTFSLARTVRRPVRELPALALVAGVAIARALRAVGVARASLKWPNDLVVDGAKLGGILVETRGRWPAVRAVIGVGVNCRRDPSLARRVRRRVASLDELVPRVDRNATLRAMARALVEALDAFDREGLGALRDEWQALDAHAGQRLRVRLADGRIVTGIASGLGRDGALRLLTRSGEHAIASGRVVSARPA